MMPRPQSYANDEMERANQSLNDEKLCELQNIEMDAYNIEHAHSQQVCLDIIQALKKYL